MPGALVTAQDIHYTTQHYDASLKKKFKKNIGVHKCLCNFWFSNDQRNCRNKKFHFMVKQWMKFMKFVQCIW